VIVIPPRSSPHYHQFDLLLWCLSRLHPQPQSRPFDSPSPRPPAQTSPEVISATITGAIAHSGDNAVQPITRIAHDPSNRQGKNRSRPHLYCPLRPRRSPPRPGRQDLFPERRPAWPNRRSTILTNHQVSSLPLYQMQNPQSDGSPKPERLTQENPSPGVSLPTARPNQRRSKCLGIQASSVVRLHNEAQRAKAEFTKALCSLERVRRRTTDFPTRLPDRGHSQHLRFGLSFGSVFEKDDALG
jgi:hypothetical protein